jgi:putative transposase
MATKQRFTADEKLRIVEEARQPGANVSETCHRHGIAASAFYRWEAQMREGARRALAEGNGGRKAAKEKAEAERLREQLAKKNNVIAELTEALLQERRGLSDYLRAAGSKRR